MKVCVCVWCSEPNDGAAAGPRLQPCSADTCQLTASGKFGDYVMLTTSRSAIIIDARQLTTQCDWYNVTRSAGATVWIEPLRL